MNEKEILSKLLQNDKLQTIPIIYVISIYLTILEELEKEGVILYDTLSL